MAGRSWLGELRTALTGVDPGLARLRLAAVGTASMALAAGVTAVVQALTGQAVFAGTSSRGDVLSRGGQRIAGTVGGVLAGMGLAVLVSGSPPAALVLLFGCVFLALYLVRVSQALMAFWITVVLALLYGLIGQFSVDTLVVRVEETAAGAVVGMLAGYLVLPTRTREAFGDAADDLVDGLDAALGAAAAQILGRAPGRPPADLAREVHDRAAVLRARAVPLDSPLPWRRGRSSYQRIVQVLTGVDHSTRSYTRSLVRLAGDVRAPGWTALDPAVARVRDNLDALRRALLRRDPLPVRSAEDVIDAAEAAAHHEHPQRADLLAAARLLRRVDQSVVALAADLGVPPDR